MKMIDHNHFICHLILGTFTEYPKVDREMFVEGVKIINTQYRVFISDDLILKTPSSFFIFCTNSKNFCTKNN